MILCVYCQRYFRISEGTKNCNTCSLFGGCQKIKCPYCQYEMPEEEEPSNERANLN